MTEWYIYNCEDLYRPGLDRFHDKYVRHLLMSGIAPVGTDIEDIKMTLHPQTTESYCKKVIGGLMHIKPFAVVRLIEDSSLVVENIFTQIDDGNDYFCDDTFMVQSVMDWGANEKYCCQVWYLDDISKQHIKDFWYNV